METTWQEVLAAKASQSIGVQNVPIGAAYSTAKGIEVGGNEYLGVEIKNTGANPFTGFIVKAKYHVDGNIQDLYETAGDFSSPDGIILLKCDGAPVTLAAGASVFLLLKVSGIAVIIIKAKSAGGTTADGFAQAN